MQVVWGDDILWGWEVTVVLVVGNLEKPLVVLVLVLVKSERGLMS